jgi:DNA-binding PadR family transcriptional regulator
MTRRSEPEAFLPLHPLEFRILMALLDGPSHGYDIVKTIEAGERHGAIYPANLYRRIRDLLRRDLVVEVATPRGADPEGRRRYVAITALGRRVARSEAVRLRDLLRDARAKRLLGSA